MMGIAMVVSGNAIRATALVPFVGPFVSMCNFNFPGVVVDVFALGSGIVGWVTAGTADQPTMRD